jgi:hypothetical protein
MSVQWGAHFAAAADPSIVTEGDAIRIKAGVLERIIRVSGGNVATESLTVSGTALSVGRADELSFRITRAEPNRNPLELPLDRGGPALGRAFSPTKRRGTGLLGLDGPGWYERRAVGPRRRNSFLSHYLDDSSAHDGAAGLREQPLAASPPR